MKDMKFVIIILLMFFGSGIMAQINDYNYNVNRTGIMYQENDNIVLNENNRFYDYDIDSNLDKSYLHYSPVKKGGLLDSLYNDKSKNLAIPDLTDKDYLGDGWYQLRKSATTDFRYNIYNGYWYIDGGRIIPNELIFNLEIDEEYTASFIYISGVSGGILRDIDNRPRVDLNLDEVVSWVEQDNGNWSQTTTANNDELIFKLQIEKGTTATPYTVPYIPALQIAFNGTNQVEYINPFVEQIIEINDISNVNNIDFELLNTKNSAVFNWNITTNPNIPFVRFYNNQTKLLYDFTNVKEMNNIGNSLVGSRSNMINIFNNALDLVDTFYQGFQKLFSTKTIETIRDALSGVWPLLSPKWPWTR